MILVLNCGSQSIKWKIFDDKLKLVKEGKKSVLDQKDFQRNLEDELIKISAEKIDMIGHRVVHGGRTFSKTTKITQENILELEKLNHLAPLHNPYNISGIKTCQKLFKDVSQFAVFDTEFFKDLPEEAYTYALPEQITKEFGFRKYGFHGVSHEYVAKIASEKLKKPFNKLKIITCHLGGGASITAIKNGVAVDTSMGFTPLEGLVMMTRPGNIDAGLVLELVREFTLDKAREILNKDSGIKGICGESNMLEVLKLDDEKTKLAFNVFVYSIKKYIGAYFAILGGCDALVFTGSIGAGLPQTREAICKDLDILTPRGPGKKTKIMAIDTDEELAIAQKII